MAALAAGMDISGHENKLIYTESVYTDWGEKDGAAAADWVNSNLKGIEKSDEILSTFSSAIIDIDPQSAVTWASKIYDEGQRNENLSMLLKNWSPWTAIAVADGSTDRTSATISSSALALSKASRTQRAGSKNATIPCIRRLDSPYPSPFPDSNAFGV